MRVLRNRARQRGLHRENGWGKKEGGNKPGGTQTEARGQRGQDQGKTAANGGGRWFGGGLVPQTWSVAVGFWRRDGQGFRMRRATQAPWWGDDCGGGGRWQGTVGSGATLRALAAAASRAPLKRYSHAARSVPLTGSTEAGPSLMVVECSSAGDLARILQSVRVVTPAECYSCAGVLFMRRAS